MTQTVRSVLSFRSRIFATAVALALAVSFGTVLAGTHIAKLDGGQEVPPVITDGNGVAKLVLNKNTNELRIVLAFGNLSSPQTAAHIHGPAPPGVNAGVLLPLPLGIFDETFIIDDATEDAIQQGLAYFNVHTVNHPGGEIRGQITEQVVSVEATSWGRIKDLYR